MVLTPDFNPTRPVYGEPPSPLVLASAGPSHPPIRRTSTGNYSQLSDFHLDDTPGTPEKGNGVRGVKHVELSINGSEWRQPVFKEKILGILKRLKVPQWSDPALKPTSIHLQRVSGALTNAVFFVSFNPAPTPTDPTMSPLLTPTLPPSDPNHPPPFAPGEYPATLLFRIYGPSSDALISRDEELRILYVLSTQYGLGPKVYGTFGNGRVEQFFPSRALYADELKDPKISRGIARRMRELHSVDLRLLGYERPEPTVWKCVFQWVRLAEETLASLGKINDKWAAWEREYNMDRVQRDAETYHNWVEKEKGKGKSVVFAHNDTQYGNLLKLDAQLPLGAPDHHRYIVIDFEYAAPNPRGYDIANHFHEWRANYHHPTLSHSLHPHYPYPTLVQREAFYRAYLSMEMGVNGEETIGNRKEIPDEKVAELEREVRIWSPACSIFWALWGIVQAEEQIEGLKEGKEDADFDYLSYAIERMEMFRKEATELGALP